MVVTGSRLHAVRYKQAFDKYIAEKGYTDIGVLVAFSGTVQDPDVASVEYTEVGMNDGIREKELPDKFDARRVPGPARRQQVPDRLRPAAAPHDVRGQAARRACRPSRPSRASTAPTPARSDTFVLDFVNDAEEIRRPSSPTTSRRPSPSRPSPQQLYDLQHKLDAAQVYFVSEVEAFAKVFYKPTAKQTTQDQAEMYRHLNPAVDRLHGPRRGEAGQLPQPARGLRAALRLPVPDHALRRPRPGDALHLRPVPGDEAAPGRAKRWAGARRRGGPRLLPPRQDL